MGLNFEESWGLRNSQSEQIFTQSEGFRKEAREEEMEITLNSGFKMPIVGLGVWRMEKGEVRDLIINAIKIGYRHLDCAGNTYYLKIFHF